MEILINTANPVIIIVYTCIVAAIIMIGKKIETPMLPGALIIISIFLLITHSMQLEALNSNETIIISKTYISLAYDFIMLLLSFISYLWIDDIVAKKKNKKSYDDSLSWFWDKI